MKNNLNLLKNIYLSKLKKTPYKLNFAITSACNSLCQTCNVGRLYKKNPKRTKDDLKLNEIKKIFSNLPNTISWMSISGGEPFLRNDLPEIIKLANQNLKNLTLISIPSNGLLTKLISKKIKQILKENHNLDFFINFSLDGPEEIHNKIRGVNGFIRTWRTYREIYRLKRDFPNLEVGLETTISRLNLNKIVSYYANIPSKHKVTVTIAHEGYLYKNDNISKKFILNEHTEELESIRKIIEGIYKRLKFTKPSDVIEYFYLKKIPLFLKLKRTPLPCTALLSSIAIDPKGIIVPCFMWGEKIGNLKVNNFNFIQIWNSRKCQSLRKAILMGKCPHCWTPCEAYQSIIKSIIDLNIMNLI